MSKKVREIALPGEVLGSTKELKGGVGTFIEDDKVISKFLGVIKRVGNHVSIIPLAGVYVPKRGDKVIGFVTDVEKVGWIVDINSPWQAFLSLSEAVDEFVDLRRTSLTRFYDVGDVIHTQIIDVRKGDIQLTMKVPMARKLKGGVVIKITPTKVPRLIGKGGSMIDMIKEKTKTVIRVGQNGVIWLKGENVEKAIKAIKMIDKKSHIIGLTDEISKMLSE